MPELQLNDWLTPDDITDEHNTVQFMDEGEYTTGEFDGKAVEQFVITVMLKGVGQRKWTMNKTAQRAVASHHGVDTAKWIDKEAELYVENMMVGNAKRRVIFAVEK